MKINELELQEILKQMIEDSSCDYDTLNDLNISVESFEDAGILSKNKGLVIIINDREFQISIKRSN